MPSREAEESLLSKLRTRAESAASPAKIRWERCERSAERDDLRIRLALPRLAFDRLPSGCPWRGRVVADGLLPRTLFGLSVGLLTSWSGLAAGSGGVVTPEQAADFYERERALWQRQFGAKPFYAAAAGKLEGSPEISPLSNLALLAWEPGEWRFVRGSDPDCDLAPLFYPLPPAACAARLEAWLDRSARFPRLLSEVASELGLPAAILRPEPGKNLSSYALEYRSGHHLFYRR